MRVCARDYTGTKGVYAHITPDKYTENVLSSLVRYTRPPFNTYSVPYTSHVTLICSTDELSTVRLAFPKNPIKSTVKSVDYWIVNGRGVAVFIMASPLFKHVHSLFVQKGAQHKHPQYIPHVTIALNLNIDVDKAMRWVDETNEILASSRQELVFNTIKIRDMLF